jgi:putative phosphoesterase
MGDTHIPDRATSIPHLILKYLSESMPWELILFTGDLTCEEILKWLKSIASSLHVVKGNMDYLPLPRQATVKYESFQIGLVHGDGVYPRGNPLELSKIAKRLGVQVLVSGHTHADSIRVSPDGSILLLNPGSLTGVWGGGGGNYTPSFMVLGGFSGECLQINTYRLRENSLVSSRIVYCFKNNHWIQSL